MFGEVVDYYFFGWPPNVSLSLQIVIVIYF